MIREAICTEKMVSGVYEIEKGEKKTMTLVWAHRGASGYAPENTLEAFALAISQKADGVELDVQLTKDGEVVVAHDETIDRVSNGSGRIVDYTLKELKSFAFNQTHPEYEHAKIPTLKEVYELLKPSGLTVNVELKTGIVRYEGIEEKVLKLTEEMGMAQKVIYSSFCHQTLMSLKALNSSVKTGILYSDGWLNVPEYACRLGVEALHPAIYHTQDTQLIKEAKERGLRLHVWTVNNEEDMRYLCENQVEAIITNYPDVCRGVAERVGRESR